MGRRAQLTLAAAILLFSLPKLPVYSDYRYTFDDFYYLGRALDSHETPALYLTPDYTSRAHPAFLAFLGVSWSLFGLSALPLGVTLVAAHAVAAVALGALAGRLGLSGTGQLATSLAFLLFAAPNRVFADVIHVSRTLSVALAIVALWLLARYLLGGPARFGVGYVLLTVASLLTFEDAVTTPLVGLVLASCLGRRRRGDQLVHGAALAAMAGFVVWTMGAGSAEQYGLSLGLHSAWKALHLPVALGQGLVLLHADFFPAAAWAPIARLGAAAVLACGLVLAAWPIRARLSRSRAFVFGMAWIVLGAAPYLLRPTGSVWHSRYLYLPGAGLAIVLGAVVAACCTLSPARRRALTALAVLVLALNVVTMEHMIRKIQAEWGGLFAPAHTEAAFAVARELNRRPPSAEDASLAVEPGLLTPAELRAVCERYVSGRPRCYPTVQTSPE